MRKGCSRGATVVEFAIVVPVVMLLVFGSIEIGRLNMIRNTAKNATYRAARAAMIPGATAQESVDIAQKTMRGIGVNDVDVTVIPAQLTNETQEVTVVVSVSVSQQCWLVPQFSDGLEIRQTCHLTREPSQSGF